jgi:hypothetical protein
MSKMASLKGRHISFLSVILLALSLAACSGVRLIADYDEVTDKSLTAIQQKTDDFVEVLIKKAGTDEAAFEKHKEFYNEVDQQLRRLEFRVTSIPKNDKTVDLVRKIRLVILGEGKCSEEGSSLKDLHCMSKNKGPSVKSLEINRRNINQTISAALSLELAKKQGLEQNK